MHAFTPYHEVCRHALLSHLSPTLANLNHMHNYVLSLVIYAPTLHHTTPLASVCYIQHVSHFSFFSSVCSWQRPSWPKCPALIVIDSATYLLMFSSLNINKVAIRLYDITTSESQSFDWSALHQHHTLHTHCFFIFTIAQDNIRTKNEGELLINYWASLHAVSRQQIHTSASFHTLYSGLYILAETARLQRASTVMTHR